MSSRFDRIFARVPRRLAGHAWTIAPSITPVDRPAPPARRWERWFHDPDVGEVGIHGMHRQLAGSDELVILVHGLGGDPDSVYLQQAAHRLDELGMSTLRVGLRGSAGHGRDYYHGGIQSDLVEVLADEAFAEYAKIWIIGYSLGGHIALATATDALDPRVQGIAAVCSPIDLERGQKVIDAPRALVYREYILRELRKMYRDIATDRDVPVTRARAAQVRSILEWDELIVAPRWGFKSARDYYRSVSVAHRLDALTVPSVLVYSAHDPMVADHTIDPHLERTYANFEAIKLDHGGHVYFPSTVDLGVPGDKRLMDQLLGVLGR
jgi:predicted alpha/beta-fold hydrolase